MSAAPKSAVTPQLGSHCTRARVDPKRRFGLANAVARGETLRRLCVMSESELFNIRHLLTADEDPYGAYRRQMDAQRTESSKAHTANWPDTVQAKQEAFLRLSKQEKEDEDRRKLMMIEFNRQQQEEEQRQKQAHMALKLLKEDPRSQRVRSFVLLDEALKDRDLQIATRAHFREMEEKRRKEEHQSSLVGVHDHEVKELKDKHDRISREVDLKNEHLKQMLFQISERKKLRAEHKEEAKAVKVAAEEEERERLEEIMETKRKMLEADKYNRSVAKQKPSKHDRLLERIEKDKLDEAERVKQEQMLDNMKKNAQERIRRRRQHFEEAKRIGEIAFINEQDIVQYIPKTQEVFEKCAVDLVNQMARNEDIRKEKAREVQQQLKEELHRRNMGETEQQDRYVVKAEAHRAGFMNNEEARAYQLEMQKHPEKVRMEQRAEAERLRREAGILQTIHRLQAAERKENERREVALGVEEQRMVEEAAKEDRERYRAYVESQLPSDMNPYLRRKAMELNA
uniref:Uncharacterized protein TCIL3000_11_3660 n=1 Tax=Trypanosoma congolense (strain IL3000) TaxID=1068625 RepID=G0UZZ7_TRYCI|nr:unnamed protein product [Trypanosoma congolense IL3000]